MGLSLSHGIIKRHEGRLTIDREYSQGARFLLELPAQEGLIVEERSEENKIHMGQGEKLVVVEDEPVILDLLSAQLKDIGYRVTTAKNGVEALLTFEQSPEDYDVILSDINMPDMGGDVMAQCLQRGGWDIPLILFTGQRVPDNLKRLEGTKVVDLLTKPIGVVPLSQVLRKAISKKKTKNYQS